ncbi:DUF2164 domain-containing protein [Pelagicoccus albus]|uniref:DUF2164 domain-containing protein n=1 Tax=Pelagicoccus albus TaxID=415222 RepID=A0A7X1E764_9BACT|nr:DUF2164 domain-containing protein [Pelagicoccus albus]MBC2604803.1 DUF2164 domain-containing protein [Pelagicoccus albus]
MAIEPTKEQLPELISSIQSYFREEWDQEVSELKARLLLDYVMKEIAPVAYNKGIRDAESYFRQKIEDLPGSCHEDELSYWT